jgi:hypothetical protein
MAGYFSYFQKTPYTLSDDPRANLQLVTNILHRSKFLREITENTALYYPYQIKEGETPEIIADKLYGDVNRHWIVLLFNNIVNPYYEFPLNDSELDDMILKKYGYTAEVARNTVHHFEQEITRSTIYNGNISETNVDRYTISEYSANFSTGVLTQRNLPSIDISIDGGTEIIELNDAGTILLQQATVYKAVSVYEYEFALNEERRVIKLLDAKYVQAVEQEFKKLMIDG